jgi:hypothetical protein
METDSTVSRLLALAAGLNCLSQCAQLRFGDVLDAMDEYALASPEFCLEICILCLFITRSSIITADAILLQSLFLQKLNASRPFWNIGAPFVYS